MNLSQMILSVKQKSYFSRSQQEVIEAINESARRLYFWIVKETPGKVFLKWDTSLTLTAAQQEYTLQPDLEQIVRIREQDPSSGRWRIVHSTDFNDISRVQTQFSSLYGFDVGGSDTDSPFRYYGPYEKDDGIYYIQIQGVADQNRPLEIVYSAKYVEIQDPADYFMIPEEARGCVRDYAVAECVLPNGDTDQAVAYTTSGDLKRNEYLTLVRAKSIGDTPKVGQYLND